VERDIEARRTETLVQQLRSGAWIAILIVVFIGIAIFALAMASSTSPNAAASAAGVMSLLLCPLLIAMLVFGIWWIVLMFRYRTRFTQAHQIALSQNDATRAPDETYLS